MQKDVIQIAAFACLLGLVMPLPGGDQFLDAECGIQAQHRSKRVINGTAAAMNSSPWMAFLHSKSFLIGSGTLITNRLVLTTASVAYGGQNITARLGDNWSTELEEHPVEKAIIHPDYNQKFDNDIAILQLQGTVVYNAKIRPICIVISPSAEWKEYINNIQKLTATGWDITENGIKSNELRTLDIWRKPNAYCANLFNSNITENTICAESLTGSLCYGDSGSPAGAMVLTTKGERFVQIGITSYGTSKCNGTDVFTDVMSHMSFILQVWRQYSS